MSDDIDRLKDVLEDLRDLNDALTDGHEAMRDIIAAVVPIELETDPEGHGALRTLAGDINTEIVKLGSVHYAALLKVNQELLGKARFTP